MAKKKSRKIYQTEHWKTVPEEHDFPAAHQYLSLLLPGDDVDGLIEEFKHAETSTRAAKDLLRASGLSLLSKSDAHVHEDLEKVKKGELLSPVLVVRGDSLLGMSPIIADGYHRICASYHINENSSVACRIVNGPHCK